MDRKLFKILLFMKRRPGMSEDEFMQYYEEKHVPLALKYSGGMKSYKRCFVFPQTHVETGPCSDLGFDVITELVYDDEAVFKNTLEYLSTTQLPEEIIADEEQLFDRTSFRMATCVEYVTGL
jgi:uncharacterized protein (TIGR02118 family)